jgi:hypothetical protein
MDNTDDSTVSFDISLGFLGMEVEQGFYQCSSKSSVDIGLKLYSPISDWGFTGYINHLNTAMCSPNSSQFWSENFTRKRVMLEMFTYFSR